MSCEWFEERLQDLLDERRDPADDSRLRSNARRCPGCQSLLEVQQRIFLVFPRGPCLDEAGSHDAVSVADPRLSDRMAHGRTKWRKWTALASSGLVVAALLAMVAGRSVGVGSVGSRSVADRTPARNSATESTRGLEFPQSIAADLTGSRPGGSWVHAELAVVGTQPISERQLALLVAQLGESISTLPGPRLDGVQELAEGIRPLADSVGSMVEALRQRWQGMRVERMETVPDTSCVLAWSWVA